MSEKDSKKSEAGATDRRAIVFTEWTILVLLALASLVLRTNFAISAGALWRDEVNSVNLASVSTIQELYSNLEFDSFPFLWLVLLRFYILSGIGSGDVAIRILGFIVSLGVPVATFFVWRYFKTKPFFLLVYCGIAPLFVVWAGVANRGYGLGVALLIWFVCQSWSAYVRRRFFDYFLVGVAALLAVHTLFYNALMVFAVLSSLAVVALARFRVRQAIVMVACGAIPAVSMLIYAPAIRGAQRWNALVYGPIDLQWLRAQLTSAVGEGGDYLPVVLFVLLVAALIYGSAEYVIRRRKESSTTAETSRSQDTDAILFAVLCIVLATVCHFAFLLKLNYYTAPWYYVTLVAMLAVCADIVFGKIRQSRQLAYARLGVAAVLLFGSFPVAWNAVSREQTNVARIASHLEKNAAAEDLIIVYPWFPAITLNRYYHGQAQWAAIPDIKFYAWHRYDLVKAKISDPLANADLLDRVRKTLDSGHRVWIVCEGLNPTNATTMPTVPPAPSTQDSPLAWARGGWDEAWGEQFVYTLQSSNAGIYVADSFQSIRTNRFERPRLLVAFKSGAR